MANEVKLTLAADSAPLAKGTKEAEKRLEELEQAAKASGKSLDQFEAEAKKAGKSVDALAREVKESQKRFDEFSERADVADTRAMGFRDGVTGLQDSMAGLSQVGKGDLLGTLFLLGAGFGDLASSTANFAGPVLKNLVTKLGVARLALLATGAAAAVVVAALAINEISKTTTDVDALTKSLNIFNRTGVRTGELRRVFGDNATAVSSFRDKLKDANKEQQAWNNSFGRVPKPDFLPDWDRDLAAFITGTKDSRDEIQALDQAYADMVNSGMDAAQATDDLRSIMGEANYQYALANGLLPEFAKAAGDAAEGQQALAGHTQTTASAYRAAANNLQTFSDLLRAQTDPIFAHSRALKAARDAQADYDKAVRDHGASSQEATDAQAALAQAQLDVFYADSRLAAINEDSLNPTLEALAEAGYLSGESMKYLQGQLAQTEAAARRAQGALSGVQGALPSANGAHGGTFSGRSGGNTFHDGGVVPGPRGMEVAAVLQAGERVIPLNQADSYGGGTITVNLVLDGKVVAQQLVNPLSGQIRAMGGEPWA